MGYSLVKGIGDGEPIASERFTVGGHEWVSPKLCVQHTAQHIPGETCWHHAVNLPINNAAYRFGNGHHDSNFSPTSQLKVAELYKLNLSTLRFSFGPLKLNPKFLKNIDMQVLLFYPDGKRSSSTEGQVNQGGGAAAIAAQPHFPGNEAQLPPAVPQEGQAVLPGPHIHAAAQPAEIRGIGACTLPSVYNIET